MGVRHHRPGSVAAKKGLDEAHTAATAGSRQVLGGRWIDDSGRSLRADGGARVSIRHRADQLAGASDVGRWRAGHSDECGGSLRARVQEKAAQELVGRQGDGLEPAVARGSALGTIVLAAEGHAPSVERDQAAVGDRRPMGEARQVGQHRNRRQRVVVAGFRRRSQARAGWRSRPGSGRWPPAARGRSPR